MAFPAGRPIVSFIKLASAVRSWSAAIFLETCAASSRTAKANRLNHSSGRRPEGPEKNCPESILHLGTERGHFEGEAPGGESDAIRSPERVLNLLTALFTPSLVPLDSIESTV
jgi:hypothetical protein